MAMRIQKNGRIGATSKIVFPSPDEAYVRECATLWLKRVMERGVKLDQPFFELVQWILGEDFDWIVLEVEKWLRKKTHRISPDRLEGITSEFEDAGEDPSQLPCVLEFAVVKSPKGLSAVLCKRVLSLLNKKRFSSSAGKKSIIAQGRNAMKKAFRLSPLEADLCMAVHVCNNWRNVEEYFEDDLDCLKRQGRGVLSAMLGASNIDLRKALGGKLSSLNILDRNSYLSLEGEFEFFFDNGDPGKLLSGYFSKINGKPLPLGSYDFKEEELSLVCDMLNSQGDTPTHVLLYGEPGTGKTSLSHSLAQAIGKDAYRVEIGKDNETSKRRAGIEACLIAADQGKNAVVVVDEADQLLNTKSFFFDFGDKEDKGWLNQLLERPETRIIWITNDVSGIEDSVMRRFVYSLKFKRLDFKQRRNLWERILRRHKVKGLVDDNQLDEFVDEYAVSAGNIDLAIRKAKELSGRNSIRFRQAMEMSLSSGRILAKGEKRSKDRGRVQKNYSLDGLNIKADLDEIMTQLDMFNTYLQSNNSKSSINMNLLFYGPPGTGKTELSRYIAKRLERRLLVKKASDIMSPYVGMTERHIAEAFREAEEKGAVLVVDEADSFIFSRDIAVRSWEASFVNEFLSQMEAFQGLLVCTTNRFVGFDQAAVRRFNHKLGFDYLTAEGNRIFYTKMLAPLTKSTLSDQEETRLKSLRNLAPGDFKVVHDRFAFYPADKVAPAQLVDALASEATIKGKFLGQKKLGF